MQVKSSQSGFILIEICIGLIVVGLIISSIFSWQAISVKKENIKKTQQNMALVQYALLDYYKKYNRYPCPAAVSALDVTELYARESDCNSDTLPEGIFGVSSNLNRSEKSSYKASKAQSSYDGFAGYVPTRTLGIPDNYSYDGWGGKITYVVTNTAAANNQNEIMNKASIEGKLFIEDGFGQLLIDPPATFVLLSHGEDHSGELTSSVIESCKYDTYDGENCDGDTIFVRDLYSLGDNISFYNDTLLHDRDISFMGDSVLKNTLEKLISCQAKGAFYDPDDEHADSSGCITSTLPSGSCPQGQVLIGVESSGQLNCAPNMQPSLCQGGQVLIGYDENGQAVCSDLLLKIQSCAQAGLLYAGEGNPSADAQGCVAATVQN